MEFNLVTQVETCYNYVQGYPHLLLYSHIPTAIFSVLMGIFVYFRSRNSQTEGSKVFLLMTMFFSFWAGLDLLIWWSYDSRWIMFIWALVNFVEMLVSVSVLYFSYVFLERKDVPFKYKMLFGTLLTLFVVFIPTVLNIPDFNVPICEAKQGVLIYYFYALEIFFFLFLVVYLVRKIFLTRREEKKAVIYFSVGAICFLFSFSGANVIASVTGVWEILQYGLFGMPVFLVSLVYLIVRFNAFNIKLLSAQALIMIMVALIAAQFFFIQSNINRVLTGVTLLLVFMASLSLVRAVRGEIQRKEELQMMADRLAQANQRLKKLDKAKSDFISIASHQLRTPLTSIKGFISLILEGSYGVISGEVQNALNKVYLSNERLIHLVEDLLNISRIESGKLQFRIDVCDVVELVRDVSDMFMLRAKEKGLAFSVNLPKEGLPVIMTDGQKVREVLSNIIDNAVKYSEKGEVNVWADCVEEKVRIFVKDTGIGIEPEDLPYLFQKFSRGKDIGRVHANGTGLGLYVGKNLIEALNGSIIVDSEGPGEGSIFSIELPVTPITNIARNLEQQVFGEHKDSSLEERR